MSSFENLQNNSFGSSSGSNIFILQKGNAANYIGYILLWIVFILAISIHSTFKSVIKNPNLTQECSFSSEDIATIISISTAVTYFTGALLYVITVASFPSMEFFNWFVIIGGSIFIFAAIGYIQNLINQKSELCKKSIPGLKTIDGLSGACMAVIAVCLLSYFLHSRT